MHISKFRRMDSCVWPGKFLAVAYVSSGEGEGECVEHVTETLLADRTGLDGVCIASRTGDPLDSSDLHALLRSIRVPGLDVFLATAGGNPRNLDDLVGARYVDRIVFMVDGKPHDCLGDCVDVARHNGCPYMTTLRVIPGITDSDTVVDVAEATRGSEHLVLNIIDPAAGGGTKASPAAFKKKEVRSMAQSVRGLAKDVVVIGSRA